MSNDEVFGRVDFSVSSGFVPWGDPSEYVHTVTGKIIAYSEMPAIKSKLTIRNHGY